MTNYKIYVCHRNRLIAECLARALQSDDQVFCNAVAPEDQCREWPAPDPDGSPLLIMDPALENGSAWSLIDQFRATFPLGRLLLLIGIGKSDRLLDCCRMKANGWINDDASLVELSEAIECIMRGNEVYSSRLTCELIAQLGRTQPEATHLEFPGGSQLTQREREILKLIAWEQLSNKSIARRLHLSLFTVKNHVHSIIDKLGAKDRHHAARIASRDRLLADEAAVAAPQHSRWNSVGT